MSVRQVREKTAMHHNASYEGRGAMGSPPGERGTLTGPLAAGRENKRRSCQSGGRGVPAPYPLGSRKGPFSGTRWEEKG